jgi:hypothetical protein
MWIGLWTVVVTAVVAMGVVVVVVQRPGRGAPMPRCPLTEALLITTPATAAAKGLSALAGLCGHRVPTKWVAASLE